LAPGRKLMLCGVHVAYPQGLAGNSDGDVGLHAIIDALLGAAGMGDIGEHFPPNDDQWADADSKDLLAIVKDKLDEKDWEIANIDVIIHAEEPRLEPYKGQMKRCIAGVLAMDFANVNVKAKTCEGFGDVGAGDAIASTAIALIKKRYRRPLYPNAEP
jgi:2-C-methyl-D-erythritol 2,4-cyclodiphosphate synthase